LSAFATLSMLPPPQAAAPTVDDSGRHLCEAYAALEQTGLALAAFHRREGRLPDRLEELVGADLDRVPADPFSPHGEPLRYAEPKRRGQWRVVYSIGPDRADQGGVPRDPLTGRGDLLLPVF
jgi:hypothetical protein